VSARKGWRFRIFPGRVARGRWTRRCRTGRGGLFRAGEARHAGLGEISAHEVDGALVALHEGRRAASTCWAPEDEGEE
jgi:hypothetical protein